MELNKIFCGSDVKNTGVCDCYLDPKLITGAILVPIKRVFTAAELADDAIATTFTDLTLAARTLRGYPFVVFNGVTDNQEDPTIFTSGYGSPEPVREGSYNWIFNFRKGGINLSNALRSFNGLIGKYGVIFIDNTNLLIGTTRKDANGEDGLGAISLETLYTYPWKLADGTNPAQYRTQFAFRPEYINDNIAYGKVDTSVLMLSELIGLETIQLTAATFNGTTGAITGVTDCGSTDLYDLYADELANEEAWTGLAADDGAVLVPTSVTKNAGLKGWTVTFAEAVSEVNLAAPAVLAVAPVSVVGYEGVAIEFGS